MYWRMMVGVFVSQYLPFTWDIRKLFKCITAAVLFDTCISLVWNDHVMGLREPSIFWFSYSSEGKGSTLSVTLKSTASGIRLWVTLSAFRCWRKLFQLLHWERMIKKWIPKVWKPGKNHNLSKTTVKRKQIISYFLLFIFFNSPEVSLVLLCPYLAKSAPYGSSQHFF